MVFVDVDDLPLNPQTICSTVSVGESRGSTVYRNVAFQDELFTSFNPSLSTYIAFFERAVGLYADRPCLSFRKFDYDSGKSLLSFTSLSFSEVNKKRLALGSGILAALSEHIPEAVAGHIQNYTSYSSEFHSPIVSIFSSNRHEWILADLACHGYSLTNTALYDNLGDDVTLHILKQTETPFIFTSGDHVRKLVSLKTKHNLPVKVIVSFDPISSLLKNEIAALGISFYHLDELEALGSENTYDLCPPHSGTLFTVSFTSGTTDSRPKGVLLTHQAAVCAISFLMLRSPKIERGRTFIFLPLTHIYERQTSSFALMSGYSLGFPRITLDPAASNPFESLLEDLRAFKPHYLSLVPRILTRFEDYIKNHVDSHPQRDQIQSVIDKRDKEMGSADYYTGSNSDLEAYNELRLLVGFDNLIYTQTAAAPANRLTLKYLKAALNIGLSQMYGLTETYGALSRSIIHEASPGSSGAFGPSVEAKLKDRNDMGYSLEENKGELLLRGPQVFKGYFKDEEETRKAFDEDGWFSTGDVAHIEGGKLYVIDRVKNFFKLAHGEYLSPERIENIYLAKNPLIEQLFLYGDPTRNFLVGIVGISFEGGCELLKRSFRNEKELLEEINTPGVKQQVLLQWNAHVRQLISGIERMKNVYIEINPLTVERGVVTPTLKLKRPVAGRFFRPILKKLYEDEGSLATVSNL